MTNKEAIRILGLECDEWDISHCTASERREAFGMAITALENNSKKLEKDDFGTLAICAIRYCNGRQTYMPGLIRSIVRSHLQELSDKDLNVMIDDCDYQEHMHLYGDDRIDKPGWIKWREELIAERKRRTDER